MQAPFFAPEYDLVSLYASLGMISGHEISHGFDSNGVNFNAVGSVEDGFSKTDRDALKDRFQCFINQYTAPSDIGVMNNGTQSLPENIADNNGLRIAFDALKNKGEFTSTDKIKQFFYKYAQMWCMNETEQQQKAQVARDVHALAVLRVNGPLQNMPEFQDAFQCSASSKMVNLPRCTMY
eukprot:TRINITY_DN2897_c0_g1_i20.p1 TRINITY_DN2897_c0_g1~~TRINITY_DN2897_c0_g1_i20.p1  ORF type:complete len:180 (-),score=55.05 TRINITY_DN2897_c0_g1_i20:971-1510(-)